MKRQVLSSLLMMLFACVMTAQVLQINPTVVDANFTTLELSDFYLDLEADIHVSNVSNDTIEVKWVREVPSTCPDAWETQVCDNNSCYNFNVGSNISPSLSLDAPFVLAPGETFNEFLLHVWPRQSSGCCQMKIHFSLVGDPDNILQTVDFNVKVNAPDCDPLADAEEKQEAANISIYPNPTSGQFTLTNNESVRSLVVYNVLGKKMRTFTYRNGKDFSIADLADGLYLVSLQNAQDEVLKTLRVSKQGLRP